MSKSWPDFQKGFQYAFVNSKSLLKIATSSYKQKQYGIASSLNVLAAEEAIKSFYLLIRHYFPLFALPDYDDMFSKHKVKHRNLIWLSMMYTILVDYMIALYQRAPEAYDQIINNPSTRLERNVARTFKWALKEKKDNPDFEEIMTWLSNANNQKNNGFYVNISKDEWIVPQNSTETKFEKEKQSTQSLLLFIQMLARDFKNQEFLKEMQISLDKFMGSTKSTRRTK